MTHSNITSGFKATGLYPFNPQAIPETAFAPSILTEVSALDGARENAPALEHPNVSESGVSTPSILSEASTPDRDQENIPPLNSDQQKSSESTTGSPSILAPIPIPDVCLTNISPVDCLRPATPEQTKQSPAIASTSTGQVSRETTVQRSYYRTIYGTSSSSDESDDDLPLNQLTKKRIYDLMPTPVKDQPSTPSVRRKAINYRGTPVTKDLFNKYNQEKRNSKEEKDNKRKKNKQDKNFTDVETGRKEKTKFKKALNPKKTKVVSAKKSTTVKGKSQKQGSWYCHACKEDRRDAMRKCSRCSKWYHEECVGLTAEDTDDFQCPGGCE